MDKTTELLLEIVHCPNVDHCRATSATHPCGDLVRSQRQDKAFQLPEPWSGDLEHAPLLFLSSNPSISPCERTPETPCSGEEFRGVDWTESDVVDFYTHRFSAPWAKDYFYTLRHDSTYQKGGGNYWGWARNRAMEALGRKTVPGTDFCLSEVVHCKSKANGTLVSDACVDECAGRYLVRLLGRSGAKVVVAVGLKAHAALCKHCGIKPSDLPVSGTFRLLQPFDVGGKSRCLAYLPAPAGPHGPKRFTAAELAVLSRWLASAN